MADDNAQRPIEELLIAVLRNQRLMMIALAGVVKESKAPGFAPTALCHRVEELEQQFPWITPPGERAD